MWKLYVPEHKQYIEADEITINFRMNAVSYATISFHDIVLSDDWLRLSEIFQINEDVQILYKDEIVFRGYVQHVSFTKSQKGYQAQITLYDPLGKLVKITYRGGISSPLYEVLDRNICSIIGIKNYIDKDVQINLRYDNETPLYSVLVDVCTMARYLTDPTRFGFYYNHRYNALCELNDTRYHKQMKSISTENRLSINYSYGYIMASTVQVSNVR